MVKNFIVAALVALAVTIYALIECIRTPSSDVRSISKPAWILAIVLVPLVGAVLWFWLGRPRSARPAGPARPGSRPSRPSSPDDDADFLRELERQRRKKAREDEERRRERELRALEDQLEGKSTPAEEPEASGEPAGTRDAVDGADDDAQTLKDLEDRLRDDRDEPNDPPAPPETRAPEK
ncbi:PLD nuclease N-terminal domain-containing protein [Arthrobacter halodurans]|uniref:PLD nuclease N-terminal domain-containing protein n=1 Tax=Arthrobacter halodurans TaxID=516699 RepID=A0ABV4UPI9_9MICC